MTFARHANKRLLGLLLIFLIGLSVFQVAAQTPAVFDYAMAGDTAWVWGSGIYVYGAIYGQTCVGYREPYGCRLYGDAVSGADIMYTGSTGFPLSTYWSSSSLRARPGNPTASANGLEWPMGYTGTNVLMPNAPIMEWPFSGNMDAYRDFAVANSGRVSQAGVVIVTNVYEGAGPDGLEGTLDDNCLILDGTINPIVIQGPVVIPVDLIIRGQVTGQGSLYAGRNIHILGSISYVHPPQWPKPDTNALATAESNRTCDLLGLFASGNLVLGNYFNSTWRSSLFTYMKPPFAQAHDVAQEDVDLGYDSDGISENGCWFNADYTKCPSNGLFTNMPYYCSMVSSALVSSLSTMLTNIDATCYARNGFFGYGGPFTFNGCHIAVHDMAIVINSSVRINWDIRTGSHSYDRVEISNFFPNPLIGRPREPQPARASQGAYTNRVALSWVALSNADSYAVWRNESNEFYAASMIFSGVGLTQYLDESVGPGGTSWYYWVAGTNRYGWGDRAALTGSIFAAQVPYAWKVLHFGENGNYDDSADSDGDGWVNADEYVADTQPTNVESRFICSFLPDAPVLQMTSISSQRIYEVNLCSNLVESVWPLYWTTNGPDHDPLTVSFPDNLDWAFFHWTVRVP